MIVETAVTSGVLGLDVALTKAGIARWDGSTLTSKGGDKTTRQPDLRLKRLERDLESELAEHPYYFAIMEDLPVGAHGAGLTGFAQGVARLVLQRHAIPLVTIAPSSLKKWATGDGRADKLKMHSYLPTDVQAAIDPANDDEVDAWWLREMGLERLRPGGAVPMTKKRGSKLVSVWEGWGM